VGNQRAFDVFQLRPALVVDREPELLRTIRDMYPAIYIATGSRCNLRCRYCIYEDRSEVTERPQLEQALAAAGREFPQGVPFLIGGEPTLHPDFDALLAAAGDAGFSRIGLATNATTLTNPERVESLVHEHRVHCFTISFDSHNPVVQNWFARRDTCWDRVSGAIELILSQADTMVAISTIVTRRNIDDLEATLDFIDDLEQRHGKRVPVVFSALKPRGSALMHREQLVLSPQHLARGIQRAIRSDVGQRLAVGCLHLPPCLLREEAEYCIDLMLSIHEYMLDGESLLNREVRPEPQSFVSSCQNCRYRAVCPGVSEEYLRWFGRDEYEPI